MKNAICRGFARLLLLSVAMLPLAASAADTTDTAGTPIKYYFSPKNGEFFNASRKMTPAEEAATSAAAQKGDAAAQYRMALSLLETDINGKPNDKGGAVDDKAQANNAKEAQALALMQQSAQQGYSDAQVYLGTMYRNGQGVPVSREKAVEWYEKAIQAGNPHAIFEMGSLSFEKRWGRDVPKTIEYFKKAAEAGDIMAQVATALFMLEGKNIPKDTVQGEAWLKKAVDTGDPFAQFGQATLYMMGKYYPQDMEKAAEWFKKSAAQNYRPSIGLLKLLEFRIANPPPPPGTPMTKDGQLPPAK